MFYPVFEKFPLCLPGMGVDVLPEAWGFSLLYNNLLSHNINFFETDYIAYPNSSNLMINSISVLSMIIYFPFVCFWGTTFTYNLNIFLSFIITAYTTYLLAKYLTDDIYASFIAGLIFTFCPYRIFHVILGHLSLLRNEFIPLYIMFLLKFIKDINLKNTLLFSLLFIINIYTSIYITFILVLFSSVFIIYNIKKLFIRKNLRYIIIVLIIILISTLPFLYAFKSEGDRYFTFQSLKFTSDYSADLMAFISPTSFNPFWGDGIRKLNFNFTWSEHFLGYTVIIILLYGIIKVSVDKSWIIAGIISFILSLGPTLKIMDKTGSSIFLFPVDDLNVTVPLPYIIMYYLCSFVRNPGRFTLFTLFSIAILCAYYLKDFLNRSGCKKIFITILLTIFILIEYAIIMPLTNSQVPDIYHIIGKEKGDYTVLEIPVFIADGWHNIGEYNNRIQYYQTVHKKRILNAYLGRLPESFFYYYSNIPVIGTIVGLEGNSYIEEGRVIIDKNWIYRVLYFFNIKYIIIHPPFTDSPVEEYIKKIMYLKSLGYDTKPLKVFEVPEQKINLSSVNIDINDPGSILYMLEGWEWAQDGSDFYYKNNLKKALVMVPLSNDFSYKMTLNIAASQNSSLNIILNGKKLGKIDLNKELRKYEFDLSGSNFNRLNKFEFIQEKFQKEKIFLKVSQIKFSSKGQ